MAGAPRDDTRLTVLAVYPWPEFWSMGEGRGAAPFFLSVTSFPKHGHDMHVLMPAGTHPPGEQEYHGVTLHRMATSVDFRPEVGRSKVVQHLRRFTSYVYWFARTIPAGFNIASRIQPDVLFGMSALGAPVAYLIARKLKVPNVTRMFGTELGLLAGRRFKTAIRYWERAAFKTPASYFVMCDDGSGGDRVAKSYGVDADRLLFWPDGVDKSCYTGDVDEPAIRAKLGVPEGNRIVLSVSRLHPEKHVDRILQAVPKVVSTRGDVTFLVAGTGEEWQGLNNLADELGIRDHVIFTGAVPVREIPGICCVSDVFVTLSDRTNVLNPLHEAMTAGLAVIALDTGNTGDVVRTGETGVLIGRDDLPRLDEIILELLGDEERLRIVGEGARRSADERLSSIEERQAMEVEIVERAVREHREARRG